jgi:renalase
VPGMTAPVRDLLTGLDVTTGCTVTGLRRDGRLWRLSDDEGRLADRAFDAVFVTAPEPQARALIATAGVRWPELEPALDQVRYAPCWAVMLMHDGDPVFPETYRRDPDPQAAIAWIARDGTKPGRAEAGSAGRRTLVVHASPGWSKAHLELAPPEAASLLVEELRRMVGPGAPTEFSLLSAHRWRFAMVESAMEQPCLWSPELQLGVAGDGCFGGRVEAAYLSGLALATEAQAG